MPLSGTQITATVRSARRDRQLIYLGALDQPALSCFWRVCDPRLICHIGPVNGLVVPGPCIRLRDRQKLRSLEYFVVHQSSLTGLSLRTLSCCKTLRGSVIAASIPHATVSAKATRVARHTAHISLRTPYADALASHIACRARIASERFMPIGLAVVALLPPPPLYWRASSTTHLFALSASTG